MDATFRQLGGYLNAAGNPKSWALQHPNLGLWARRGLPIKVGALSEAPPQSSLSLPQPQT